MMTQTSRNQRMSSVESFGSNVAQRTDGNKSERKWKPFECRVNLPALLNDPTLPKRPLDIFAQILGPDFERCVPSTRPVNGMGSSRSDRTARVIPDAYYNILQRRLKKQAVAKPNAAAGALANAQLDVPRLYLSAEFNLEDVETFCTVFQLPFANGKVAFDPANVSLPNANVGAAAPSRTRTRSNSGTQPFSPRSASTSNGVQSGVSMQQFAIAHFRSQRSVLHEHLSHHLDSVETRIVAHVSRKSASFFSAIAAHDDVARTLERAALVTSRLRSQLTVADRRAVAEPLQLARVEQRRARYSRLLMKLKRVADVAQSQAMIQVFLSRNEYAGALELIEVTRDLLHGELGGLHCFRHLEPQFVELLRVILRMMQEEFTSVLQAALRHNHNSAQKLAASGELLNGDSQAECNDSLTKLGSLLLGLIATRAYYAESFATAGSDLLVTSPRERPSDVSERSNDSQADCKSHDIESSSSTRFRFVGWYRDACCAAIRTCVKDTVLASLEDAEPSSISLSVGDVLARVSADCSLSLVRSLLDALLQLLKHAALVLHTFVHTVDDAERKEQLDEAANVPKLPTPTHSETETETEQDEKSNVTVTRSASFDEFACMRRALRNALFFATSFAEERAAKIIQSQLTAAQGASAATNVDTRWSLSQYFALIDSVELYLTETSRIMDEAQSAVDAVALVTRERERHESSPPSVLMQCVRSLAGRFVARFHDDRRQKLGLILDSERWRPAEVPAEFQLLAAHVISTQQLTTLANSAIGAVSTDTQNGSSLTVSDASANGHNDSTTSAVLLLDGEEYTVVGTVLILFRMMCEYGEAAQQMGFAANEFLSRLLDLLKLFNSRTCQLILGAGAVQVAQLKTITTRNLALASRCLQLVIRILPIARKHFAALLDVQNCVPHGSTCTSAALAANAASQLMRHVDSLRKDYDDHVGELANKIVCIMDATLQDSLAKWSPQFAASTSNQSVSSAAPSNSISTHVKTAAKQLLKMHETLVGILPDLQIASIYTQVYHECFVVLLRSKLQSTPSAQRNRELVANVLQLDVTYLCDACKSIPFMKEVTFERVVDDMLATTGASNR